MHVTLPNWWSCAIPQGGRHTATLFGLMNGLGVLGAMASQGFVGVFADWQASAGYRPGAVGPDLRRVRRRAARERGRVVVLPLHAAAGAAETTEEENW